MSTTMGNKNDWATSIKVFTRNGDNVVSVFGNYNFIIDGAGVMGVGKYENSDAIKKNGHVD